ncbi:MAG TPA: cupin domain-containing protein [Candidatus Caenarcaniphilales bacterium]|nr:cupin domain-containing protein [Candidatus Caenarcaniphilales bacterium]
MTMQGSVQELRSDMERNHLIPLWELEAEIMGLVPTPRTRPWLWRWQDLYGIAERAGELVPVERGGDRRAIALANPGQGGMPYATSTLWAAVQWLNGREVAPAHRHTSQAIRFIIDGAGSYSTVEGDKVFLERGDLVLTPPWTWHDHGSESGERAIWMDVLDIPLNNFLDAPFFENYPQESQPVDKVLNGSVLKYGVGQLRPAWEKPTRDYPPLMTYKWADTERALVNLAAVDADPFDDVALEYTNPHTGGSVMKTFSCSIQMLRPGIHTRAHRHTGSSVYLAFEGHGATIIDGVRFDWGPGDMFVIPSWATHEHLNAASDERAILFAAHDTPLLRLVDKYRVEAAPEPHQQVTANFSAVAPDAA